MSKIASSYYQYQYSLLIREAVRSKMLKLVSFRRFFVAQKVLQGVRHASQFPSEVISFDDPKWFPTESGPIQKSIFGDRIEIPKCRMDQYVWANSAMWQDKTAVVSWLR